ncbi:sensor histidine kinase, partial [Cesiribacter andamanensis]|uniref:sensor histidine kinase n=1 Tax=Cesiribacter andamanensis TaxID=649507 RepID=UPI00126851BD
EGWRLRKDGSLFWANVVVTPLFNERKEHIGFTKITRDLTERVRNEALMKKNMDLHRLNTDLDNFIYTASHDLKSPISNLEGLLSLVSSKIGPRLDESEQKIIDLMSASVQRLNDTILSLIDVTKAQKNLNARRESVVIAEVLDDVKADLAEMILQAGAHIQEQLHVPRLTIAKASLKSILYNLLSNALKYQTPGRPPEISIRTYTEKQYTVLHVQDNGLGLTEAQQAKLFNMFKRFHTHVEGTGIGLYIVKRTMENLGGHISVSSIPDQGTTFTLRFPTDVVLTSEQPARLEDV